MIDFAFTFTFAFAFALTSGLRPAVGGSAAVGGFPVLEALEACHREAVSRDIWEIIAAFTFFGGASAPGVFAEGGGASAFFAFTA